ncbi:sigma-70 family RNA polymerase sigma factor [Streptomyces sp. NPDC001928]|uniref:sigma-70 family RNA polymerase sigma factor n=1 Tax=Streptomyces sp. NPDC001928 TaxID=3154404 RepID=UPI0033314462
MSWTMMDASAELGDRERVLRSLYDEQAGPLLSYATRLLRGDRHRAEDIVQETLLRCWRTQDLTSDQLLRPWLFRVARNLIIDEHRQRGARPQEVNGTAWLEDLLTNPDDVDRILSSMALKDAFRHLSANHREALYETFYVGRSMREAGETLGVPPGTVKSRVHHAIRALRLAMGAVANTDDNVGGESTPQDSTQDSTQYSPQDSPQYSSAA